MQSEIVIPEPVICNHVAEYPHINPDTLSAHAIDVIRKYYKNDTILIQYAMEGPEINIRTLHIIILDRYEYNKNTNAYNPVYRYDTFTCEYIISWESIPPYTIDIAYSKYSDVIDGKLFS